VKTKLTIKGKRVQDVGYRLFLLSRAHNLKGFEASNIGEDLILLIEGEEDSVKRFTQTVKAEKPQLAEVNEVLVEGYDGEVMGVKEYREQLSLEQLAKIATVGVEMRDDIKEMKGDIKEMKGDMKTILKKQDETLAEIRATRDEIRATREEIRSLREDLKQYMERRFERLEREIALIKQKIGLV
jgi:hydrogenase maturation factor HypF (carbamoyltransferase family)